MELWDMAFRAGIRFLSIVSTHFAQSAENLATFAFVFARHSKTKVESVFNEMDCSSPVIYLLSAGADPTDSIESLARKKRTDVACISMGEVKERRIHHTGNVRKLISICASGRAHTTF